MTKRKQYRDVLEMTAGLSGNKELLEALDNGIKNTELVDLLVCVRAEAGLNQSQMAERLDCSQSRISKLENSEDADLKVADLIDYAKVSGKRLEIGFAKREEAAVNRIKHHAFGISENLDFLIQLAENDEKMQEGVDKFSEEAFVNIVRLLLKSVSQLENSTLIKRLSESKSEGREIDESVLHVLPFHENASENLHEA